MRTKLFVLISLLLLTGLVQSPASAQSGKADQNKPGKLEKQDKLEKQEPLPITALPDLVVTKLTYKADNVQKLEVVVGNQGKGKAGEFTLALMMLSGGGPASAPTKVWTVKVPGLAPGKRHLATYDLAPHKAVDVAFKAVADHSNAVKESNEKNNELFDNSKVIK